MAWLLLCPPNNVSFFFPFNVSSSFSWEFLIVSHVSSPTGLTRMCDICLFFCLHLFLWSAPWKLADSTSGLPHATSPQWNLATGVPSREFQVNQKQNEYNLDGIHITIPNLSTLCYFKHHDFTLVCSEAAQMSCINFCYYRKIRRLRFEDASFSSSCSGIKKLELWCVSIAESTVAFLFFLLYF